MEKEIDELRANLNFITEIKEIVNSETSLLKKKEEIISKVTNAISEGGEIYDGKIF